MITKAKYASKAAFRAASGALENTVLRITCGGLAVAVMIGTEACAPMVPLNVASNSPSAKLRYINSLNDGNGTLLQFRDLSVCPREPPLIRVATTTSPSWISKGDPEVSNIEMFGSSSEPQVFIKERVIPADHPIVYIAIAIKAASPGVTGYSCENAGIFFPRSGHQYEIDYKTQSAGFRLPPVCEVSVHELKTVDSGFGPVQQIPLKSAHSVDLKKAKHDACSLFVGVR
jgi:hypothetical protein